MRRFSLYCSNFRWSMWSLDRKTVCIARSTAAALSNGACKRSALPSASAAYATCVRSRSSSHTRCATQAVNSRPATSTAKAQTAGGIPRRRGTSSAGGPPADGCDEGETAFTAIPEFLLRGENERDDPRRQVRPQLPIDACMLHAKPLLRRDAARRSGIRAISQQCGRISPGCASVRFGPAASVPALHRAGVDGSLFAQKSLGCMPQPESWLFRLLVAHFAARQELPSAGDMQDVDVLVGLGQWRERYR